MQDLMRSIAIHLPPLYIIEIATEDDFRGEFLNNYYIAGRQDFTNLVCLDVIKLPLQKNTRLNNIYTQYWLVFTFRQAMLNEQWNFCYQIPKLNWFLQSVREKSKKINRLP